MTALAMTSSQKADVSELVEMINAVSETIDMLEAMDPHPTDTITELNNVLSFLVKALEDLRFVIGLMQRHPSNPDFVPETNPGIL